MQATLQLPEMTVTTNRLVTLSLVCPGQRDKVLVFSTEVGSSGEEIRVCPLLCSRQGGSSWFLMWVQQSAVTNSCLCLLKQRVARVALIQCLYLTSQWVVKTISWQKLEKPRRSRAVRLFGAVLAADGWGVSLTSFVLTSVSWCSICLAKFPVMRSQPSSSPQVKDCNCCLWSPSMSGLGSFFLCWSTQKIKKF